MDTSTQMDHRSAGLSSFACGPGLREDRDRRWLAAKRQTEARDFPQADTSCPLEGAHPPRAHRVGYLKNCTYCGWGYSHGRG